jgi:hypothetical protein
MVFIMNMFSSQLSSQFLSIFSNLSSNLITLINFNRKSINKFTKCPIINITLRNRSIMSKTNLNSLIRFHQ